MNVYVRYAGIRIKWDFFGIKWD
ncbi:MAG: hypothetical protein RLZZ628_3876, partial [Bacteroidota bacterium]